MKKKFRLIVRNILKIRDFETIKDGLIRHKFNLFKKLYRKKFNLSDLEKVLNECGINSSNQIFVQSSWRAFVGFKCSPRDVVELLIELVGNDGTVLMPSFGFDNAKLDVEIDKTSLGSIAEEFRQYSGTVRSLDSYFPICANGKDKEKFVEGHQYSLSPFDEKSPFERMVEVNAKFVYLGLGKYPYKVSFIHYFMDKNSKLNKTFETIYNKKINCQIKNKNNFFEKKILVREEKYTNDNLKIKKAMKKVKHEYRKIGFLDVYVCNSQDLLEVLKYMDSKGNTFYKMRKKYV